MKDLINNRVEKIEISGIRKFFNMVADYDDVLSLTIGQPDFHTPTHIKEATIAAINNNQTTYTHNAGILPLREAIHSFQKKHYDINYDPASEIIVTVGASQAIDISLRSILNEADEVILPGPVYPGYEPLIKLAGGIPVHVDTRDNNFKLTKSLIEKAITNKTKCIIMPYPSNPTGVSLTKDELKEIAALIKENNLFLIADEIYSELTYHKKHVSIGIFTEIREQTIIINGLSKSHSMTGFRIGYLLTTNWLCSHILKVHQYNVSCASSVSQYAALEALTIGENDSLSMKEEYVRRRDYVYDRLQKMGIKTILPDGAFYFFIPIKKEGLNSFEIALELVKTQKLALVPGDAFSQYGEGYLRLSYAYSMTTLQEGMDRLEKYLIKNEPTLF
ncbi:aminotransferase A [Saliterribacillus persicus]|uniref:Aminotransferase n=1 Tax=Saliterribacillus persicus TaxID=930114 RepID=A0A368XVE2_9BACI|nr:aminotransferase A [Saliterribacillus persicus]RCW71845.1 aminotransferase [Saliterribacillus persicus]